MDFLLAVAKNDIEKARYFLQSSIDVNSPVLWNARETFSPVLPPDAASRPDLRERLQRGQEYHSRPLNIAVLGGHADMVRLLLSAGADINLKDGRGRTALICAIYGLDLDVADINTANLPLISKTHEHHLEIMRNILLRHPNIDVTTLNSPQYEIKGITPLCLASYLGKAEIIQLLLEDGRVNVDGTDSKSATALMYAARDGNLPIVKTLLSYNASPDITDAHGWSAIQYAGRSPDIVQLYEEALRCKRPELTHLHGKMPLCKYPINYTKLSTFISSLPSYPSSLSHVQFDSLKDIDLLDQAAAPIVQIIRSAFLHAVKTHDHHTLQTLLLWSPPLRDEQRMLSGPLLVNHHDTKTGLTPLHYAMRAKPLPSIDTIILLYQAGADVNSQTLLGRTALHHLARIGVDKDGRSWGIQKSNKGENNNGNNLLRNRQRTNSIHRPTRMNSLSSLSSQPNMATTSPTSPTATTDDGNRFSIQSSGSNSSSASEPPNDPVVKHIMAAPTVPQHLAMCASLLVRLGALVNIADPNGNTPLHFAAEFGGVPEVLEVLILEGADLTLKNMKGLTPIDMCRTDEVRSRMLGLEHERKQSLKTKSSTSYLSSNIKPLETASDYRSSLSRSVSRSTLQSSVTTAGVPPTASVAGREKSNKWRSKRRGSSPEQPSSDTDEEDVDGDFEKILKAFFDYQTTFTDSIESALARITDSILNNAQMSQEEHADSTKRVQVTTARLRYELQEAHEMFDDTDQRAERVMLHYREELEQVEQIHQADWDMCELQYDKVEKLFDVFERIDGRFCQLELDQDELIMQVEQIRKAAAARQTTRSETCESYDEFMSSISNITQSLTILDTLSVDPILYSREDISRLCRDIGQMVDAVLQEIDEREDDKLNEARETIEKKWEVVRNVLNRRASQDDLENQISLMPSPPVVTKSVATTHWQEQLTAARLYPGGKQHRKRQSFKKATTLNELELSYEILQSNLHEVQKDLDVINQQVAQVLTNKRKMYDTCLKLEGELTAPEKQRTDEAIRAELAKVLTYTQTLFDKQKSLESDRTQLRFELNDIEKRLEKVQESLRLVRPPLLLQGLLERLETDIGPIVRIEKDWKEDTNFVSEVYESEEESDDTSSSASNNDYIPKWLDERFASKLSLQCLITRLDASLYCLKVLARNHIGRSRQLLLEVQATLNQANAELEDTRTQMNVLYDDAAEVAHQVFTLKTELETIVKHRKEEIVKVWEVVEEVSEGIDIIESNEIPPPLEEDKKDRAEEEQDRHQWIVHELEQLQTVHENLQDAIEELQRDQNNIGKSLRRLATALIEPQVDRLVGQDDASLLTISDRLTELMERVQYRECGVVSTKLPSAVSEDQARRASNASKRISVATQNSLRSSVVSARPPIEKPKQRVPHTNVHTAIRTDKRRMSIMSTSSFTSLSSYQQDRMLARASTLSSAFSRSQHSLVHR
ncbi:hypothetical protein BDB00DRAFT_928824 [Zychaea mexicana]|uniref:uncharacterized protein n=1 Tax=Zychaea mexicana TaxID=64656 RepID=UPI0022FF0869|nr:uncharacterized protein BDB00DRAFT_928824 [Zychaea mexicana]KAI9493692.1 hypothetical protein BDB00DRAFT_928824 [Zychaea mexicana]